MLLTNIDEELTSPFGDPLIFDVKDNVERACTIRRALGSLLMFQGKSQQMPDAPEIGVDESQIVFALTQKLIASGKEGVDAIELCSEEIVHLRKFGTHCMHPLVYGYMCEALNASENVSSKMAPKLIEKKEEGIAST